MRLIAIAAVIMLAGCGGRELPLNPLNWFAGSDAGPTQQQMADEKAELAAARVASRLATPDIDPAFTRAPQIEEARVDFTPRGAIVRASARMNGAGYHSAMLHPVIGVQTDQTGFITYEFLTVPSALRAVDDTAVAAVFIPNQRLRGVNAITIVAGANEVVVRVR
jgi:hypothetical protein